jgi:hypothetical protein
MSSRVSFPSPRSLDGDHVALPASRASTLADPSGQNNSFGASASMRGDLGERIAAMYYGVELVWA